MVIVTLLFRNFAVCRDATAELLATTVLAVIVCPSVRLSVTRQYCAKCPKRLNVGSRKQRRTLAHEHWFSYDKKSLVGDASFLLIYALNVTHPS